MAGLRAVGPDETAPGPRKLTVTVAASEGSRLELLVALRERVATAVQEPNTPARDLAALTRRLQEIAKDIESIEAANNREGERAAAGDEPFNAAAI